MPLRIVDVREVTKSISSPIRNAYIDFSKMSSSLVAVVTNVQRNGRPVIGFGFNSNGYPDVFQPYGGFPDGTHVRDSIVTLPDLSGIGFEAKSDLFSIMRDLAH